jgi:hypothetical protein
MYEDEIRYVDYKIDLDDVAKDNIVHLKTVSTDHSTYDIYNYDSAVLCFDDEKRKKYRSVIVAHPENRLFSFSPPKSISIAEYMKKYPEITDAMVVSEKIEGLMVNLFYDTRIQSWEIATKSGAGGNYWYFSPKNNPQMIHTRKNDLLLDHTARKISRCKATFLTMFLDACKCSGSLNDCAWINELDQHYCYSFVLQHPKNQIQQTIENPRVFLIAVYDIDPVHNRAIQIPRDVYESWPIFLNILGVVEFPAKIVGLSYAEIQSKYCSYYTKATNPGIVFWNELTGDRAVMQNECYQMIRVIKNESPLLLYQYLCLRRIDKVGEFLNYYPTYKKTAMEFHHRFDVFVKTIHRAYLDVYVCKLVEIKDVNAPFQPHIEKIHKQLYLKYIGSSKSHKITLDVIREYVQRMEPREVLYCLEHLRRRPEEN